MNPKISIVTPSFNQGGFIEETVNSVINQRYPNLEYIVIDGGSTDRTTEILKKYQHHFSYYVSERDQGHGDAINKGFAKSTGEIMGWINSDDKYYPWTFATIADIFSEFPDVSWIVGKNSWYDSRGRLYHTDSVFKNKYDFLRGRYAWIQQESVFWRRSLWEKAGAGIDTSYSYMVDGNLWGRFFRYEPLWHLDRVIGGYRLHSSNRAGLNQSTIENEMNRVVADLRAVSSEGDLSIADQLTSFEASPSWVRRLKKKFGSGRALIQTAGYPCLAWVDDRWVKVKKDYIL